MESPSGPRQKQQQGGQSPPASSDEQKREPTVPLMLRPRESVKHCAEKAAEQVGKKRSQIDEEAYLIGILLTVLRSRRKADLLGTYSRRQAAECLESVFEGLFELLYEQGMLPLAHQLLITRGGAALSGEIVPGSPPAMQERMESHPTAESVLPLLSSTAQKAFEGMPGGADGF